jgi:hypothetical protein
MNRNCSECRAAAAQLIAGVFRSQMRDGTVDHLFVRRCAWKALRALLDEEMFARCEAILEQERQDKATVWGWIRKAAGALRRRPEGRKP